MTDKERLEEIKELVKKIESILYDEWRQQELIFLIESLYYIGHVDWLIQQAERVYELESDSYNAHLERLLDRKEQEIERYREAIRECIERMDEGGAGTRSFVYEKLIEALEGEE